MVRLQSPSGEVRDVDPAEFDVEGMLRGGFQRLPSKGPDSVTVRAHARMKPGKRLPAEAPLARALPTIVGTAGGMRAGVAGATAGGMVGEVLRQAMDNPAVVAGLPAAGPVGAALSTAFGGGMTGGGAANPQEALDRTLEQGVTQGALQVGGNVLAGGAKLAGKGAMMLALKATPEAAQTAIREGITASRAGVRKLFSRMGDISARTKRLVAAAGLSRTFRAEPIADEIERQVRAELAKSSTAPGDPAVSKALSELKDQFLRRTPTSPGRARISFQEAHQYAQSASKEAESNFVRLASGEKLELPSDPIRKLWKLHEAKVLRSSLEHPAAVGAKYAELNARQSKLIALKDVLAPDVHRSMDFSAHAMAAARNPVVSTLAGAGAGAAVPEGVLPGTRLEHALGGAALTNPMMLSVLGQVLANPALLSLLTRTPQLANLAAQ